MASTAMQSRVAFEQGSMCVPADTAQSSTRSLHLGEGGCKKRNSRRTRRTQLVRASSAAPYGPGGGSELVDSNMSVLRRRIHRLRTMETMEGPPENWMEWEKSCYTSYSADVADLIANVQGHLLGMRPSVSLLILSILLSAMPVVSLLLLRTVLQHWTPSA